MFIQLWQTDGCTNMSISTTLFEKVVTNDVDPAIKKIGHTCRIFERVFHMTTSQS